MISDCELIFEAYNSNILNEVGYYNPTAVAAAMPAQQRVAAEYPALTQKAREKIPAIVAAGPSQRLQANTQQTQWMKSQGLQDTDEFKKLTSDTNAGIAAIPTGKKIAAGGVDAANNAMMQSGIPVAGRAFGTAVIPASKAFGATGVPLRPGGATSAPNTTTATNTNTNANAAEPDLFKKFHGTSYDPNSSADRKKMQHLQGLQKAGTPLTAKSVYSPAPAPAPAAAAAQSAGYNPPGTMVSRGLQSVGRGLGTGVKSIAGAAVAPFKGLYQGLTNQPSNTQVNTTGAQLPNSGGKSSIKPLFSKGGLFNR
jgi:hypothetical protein